MISILKNGLGIPTVVVVAETGTCVSLCYAKSVRTIPIGNKIQVVLNYYHNYTGESFCVNSFEDAYSIVNAIALRMSKTKRSNNVYELLMAAKVIEDASVERTGPVLPVYSCSDTGSTDEQRFNEEQLFSAEPCGEYHNDYEENDFD